MGGAALCPHKPLSRLVLQHKILFSLGLHMHRGMV